MSLYNNLIGLSNQLTNQINTQLNTQLNIQLNSQYDQEFEFRKQFSFHDRLNESTRILEKYPDRIPIICEKNKNDTCPQIDKKKYLVPFDLTIGQFIYVIRKRLHLQAECALFLFIGGTIPPSSTLVGSIYEQHKNKDGFLYVTYSKENTFG